MKKGNIYYKGEKKEKKRKEKAHEKVGVEELGSEFLSKNV